jgi:Xaa-Pro aminopeptidase
LGFLSQRVFEARCSAMRDFMEERSFAALALQSPGYVHFATNYDLDVEPWERPIAVVVPREGEPFALLHELSTNRLQMARERGLLWVDDVLLYSEHPRVASRLPLLPQWSDTLATLLRSRGLAGARIGVDSLVGPIVELPRLLPGLELVPCELELRDLRLVKHPEELDLLRLAAALSDWAQERYREEIRPGRLVQELDASVAALIFEEAAARFPAQHVELFLLTLSGPDSAAPHGTGALTGARIERGHGIVNIVIVRLNGVVVENERTWFCGEPSEVQTKAFVAACEAQAAAIEQFVTGNALASVDAAALAVFEGAGFGECVNHRTGHGIGSVSHEFPHDMAFNTRPLMANEVYSAEPGIYVPGVGGFRHDDTVIVGTRPEIVTRAPKDIAAQTIA